MAPPQQRQTGRNTPYHGLRIIKRLMNEGRCEITDDAVRGALKSFGWEISEIRKAILKLQPKHFYKTEKHFSNPGIYVDYYKARGLMGENVYIHLHVDNGFLVIESFKEI